MELKAFLAELVTSLASLDFVASLELRTEVFTVKGRVHLTQVKEMQRWCKSLVSR